MSGEAHKTLVVLLDGTSNEIEGDLTNVLKLYRVLKRSAEQTTFYHPGVGTFGLRSDWGSAWQSFNTVLGLATGWGLDENILEAYRFLAEAHRPGDRIMIFGFSRGAYTARALAGLIHLIGLLHPEQLNLSGHALTAYKRASRGNTLRSAWHFRRVIGGRRVIIDFLGLWDTVASVIVPRRDRLFLPSLDFLAYTERNPSVAAVRHACAIDERRRMFRPLHWPAGQVLQPDPFAGPMGAQDQKTVWFAGDHSDVGGGYPEAESAVAKHPLLWLAREAQRFGAGLDETMLNHLASGAPLPGGQHAYVPASSTAPLHDSMSPLWKPLEWLPRRRRWRRFPAADPRRGWYLPRAEPRLIEEGSHLHRSVIERVELTEYRPPNLPRTFDVADTWVPSAT
jgi:uncharacterized protein (DUF2235 family)